MAKLRQLAACAAAGVLVATGLSGCGSDDGGTPMLTWFAMPDNGGAVTRAQDCAAASNGAYRVHVETLPNDATQQREQLVRVKIEAVSLDSTSIKVHPDGTGALKKTARRPSASPEADGTPRFIWLPRMLERP